MNTINDNITSFLQHQTSATICCNDETGNPYCFSCYYVFNREKAVLYFKSSADAYHTALLVNNLVVSGTVLPDKLNKLVTKGIQLQGEVVDQGRLLAKEASAIYHKKIPMAYVIKGKVFAIRINVIKMTDSRLGFGKKIKWERNETGVISV